MESNDWGHRLAISEYLALIIEPERRAYAVKYLEWAKHPHETAEPPCPSINRHSARLMRLRLNRLMGGALAYTVLGRRT